MINRPEKYDPFFLWALGLFLGLGIIWLLPWRFQTNDDVMMMWLVSGAYTGDAEPYAVFIHPWLSWIFSRLYSLSPEVNWYGLTWFGVNFFSGYLLLKKIWTSPFPLIQKHFWSLFICLISFHFGFFPQFTLIAGYAALAGLMQVFGSTSRRDMALAYLAFFLGLSIRWESVVLISLGWLWAAFIFPQVRGSFHLPKLLGLVFLSVFLSLGKWGYEKKFVSEEYLNFNSARAKVLDHPVFVQESQTGNIPLSTDWYYVSRWMFEELPLNTSDFLAKKEELNQGLWSLQAIQDGFVRIFRVQFTELFKSMLILSLVLSFLVIQVNWRKKLVFLGVWVLFYFIFNHFNLLLGRVNLQFFLILLIPVFHSSFRYVRTRLTQILMLLYIHFLLIHCFNFWMEAKGRKQVEAEFFSLLEGKHSHAPVFLEGIMEYIFLEDFSQTHPVPFLSYSWISRSPMQEKVYQLRGFARLSELKEFYLLAFQLPEPLVFPDYINRISPGFELKSELKSESLVMLHFVKSDSLSLGP